jgi:hypothetical protein
LLGGGDDGGLLDATGKVNLVGHKGRHFERKGKEGKRGLGVCVVVVFLVSRPSLLPVSPPVNFFQKSLSKRFAGLYS